MIYATPVDAIYYVSYQRLSEITGYTAGVNVATNEPDGTPIALFKDAILGNDLSGYTSQQQIDVVEAVNALQVALNSASSLIDSYVSRRYELPLTSYPEWLKEACVSFANCSLHDDNEVTPIKEKCEKFTTLLEQVASGKLKLFPSDSEVVSGGAVKSQTVINAPNRVFTDSFLSRAL